MTLNFGLIRNQPSFEDGNINAYNKQDFMETGEYSELTGAGAEGAITAIYDNSITEGYTFAVDTTSDRWLQWKFDKRIKFKNIYVYFEANDGGSSGSNTFRLQGSDNGTDWTDLDTVVVSGAATKLHNLLATDVRYRYIRFLKDFNSGDGGRIEVLYMKSVV